MTACCWRLTQPENRRRKKASGGGNASMGPQLPQGAATLQAWPGTGIATPSQVDVSCPAVELPPSGKLGRVFAHDGAQAAANLAPHSRQNFACGGFSCWHRGHCILEPPSTQPGASGVAISAPAA